jgi:hypothetical protein
MSKNASDPYILVGAVRGVVINDCDAEVISDGSLGIVEQHYFIKQ